MKKRLITFIVFTAAVTLLLTTFSHTRAEAPPDDPYEAILYAGKYKEAQANPVGGIQVWNDSDTLYIRYEVDEPWCIIKTHLQVGNDRESNPHTKARKSKAGGNLVPGRRAINENLGCVQSVTYEFSLDDLLDEKCADDKTLVIAAHAVVQKEICEIIQEAPYAAITVVDYQQGLQKDGLPVPDIRSDPQAVLTWNTDQLETDFFSLGFGGGISVGFECCIKNREGADVRVIEDTWANYPPETADIYASMDGIDYVYIGSADNSVRHSVYTWQTVTDLDLGDLTYAKYIQVVDTSNIDLHSDDSDGFDLNVIQSLQDCQDCKVIKEKAWAASEDFCGSNWARYFKYEVK